MEVELEHYASYRALQVAAGLFYTILYIIGGVCGAIALFWLMGWLLDWDTHISGAGVGVFLGIGFCAGITAVDAVRYIATGRGFIFLGE